MEIIKNTGLMIFSWIGLLLIASTTYLFLGQALSGSILITSLILLLLAFIIKKKLLNYSKKDSLITLLLFMFSVLLAIMFASLTKDFSWDGQSYHQEALIQLRGGWNPIKNNDLYAYLGLSSDYKYRFPLWISHYPQGLWFVQTLFFDLTGSIEAGKAVNFLLALGLFYTTMPLLNRVIKNKSILLITTLLVLLNPVVISQLFTFYNDGTIYLLLMSLLTLSLFWFTEKKYSWQYLPGIFGILLLLVTVKFTALAYALFFLLIPLFLILKKAIVTKDIKNLWNKKNISAYILVTATILLGVLFVGRSSYVNNTLKNGHPFYPLAGEGKVDIMSYNYVEGTEKLGRISGLYVSQFSEVNNIKTVPLKTKFPFSITSYELDELTSPDTRIGGFGPLFGASLIILTIGLAMLLKVEFIKEYSFLFIIIAVVIGSSLINPETWWARYVPQFWILPILGTVFFQLLTQKKAKIIQILLLSILFINSIVTLGNQVKWQYHMQDALNQQMHLLRESGEVEVLLDNFPSNRVRLTDYGVKFRTIEESKKKYSIPITRSTSLIYTDDKELYKKLSIIHERTISNSRKDHSKKKDMKND